MENQVLEKKDYTQSGLSHEEYDNCTFIDCDLSNANL